MNLLNIYGLIYLTCGVVVAMIIRRGANKSDRKPSPNKLTAMMIFVMIFWLPALTVIYLSKGRIK